MCWHVFGVPTHQSAPEGCCFGPCIHGNRHLFNVSYTIAIASAHHHGWQTVRLSVINMEQDSPALPHIFVLAISWTKANLAAHLMANIMFEP